MNHFDPYNLFLAIATNIPVLLMTGFVLILLFIKSTVYCPGRYFIAHFIFYFIIFYFLILLFIFYFFNFFPYLYLCMFSCVCIWYNCTVHGADLTYMSLLVIFCIIVYVTNKNLVIQGHISEHRPFFLEYIWDIKEIFQVQMLITTEEKRI